MREGIFVEADHDGEWFTGHVIAMHKGKWAVRFFTHCSMPFIISETIARHLVDPIVHVYVPYSCIKKDGVSQRKFRGF